MNKVLDRTFDLSEDGLAARYRIRLYEPLPTGGDTASDAERIIVTSWDLDQPGLPTDAWIEQMNGPAFDMLVEQGGTLLVAEFYPYREYRVGKNGENPVIRDEELTMARVQPLGDGKLALLDFGEMERTDLEHRIGESLTSPADSTTDTTADISSAEVGAAATP